MAIEAAINLDISGIKQSIETLKAAFIDFSSAAGKMSGKVSGAFDEIAKSVNRAASKGKASQKPINLFDVFTETKGEISKIASSKFSIPAIGGFLENQDLIKSLSKAFQGIGRSMQTATYIVRGQFSSALNTGARAINLIGGQALGLIGIFTGATIAVAAFVAMVTAITFATNRFAQETYRAMHVGMSASELKPLELAFQKIGASADDAVPAIQSFITKLVDARHGSGDAAKALRELSVASGRDLKPIELLKKGNKEALLEVLSALKDVKNEAQRGQIASKLFTGKSGAEIKTIVDTGALEKTDGLLKNINEVTKVWGGTFLNVQGVIHDIWTALKEGIMLVFASFSTRFNMSAKLIESWNVAKMIANTFANMAYFIGSMGQMLDPIFAIVTAIFAAAVRFTEAISYALALIGRGVSAIYEPIHKVLNAILSFTDLFGMFDGITFGQVPEKKPAPGGDLPIEAYKPMQIAIASSLTKIGGGGESFGAGGADLYDLSRQQLQVQKEIRDSLRNNAPAKTSENANTWNVPAYM